MIFNVCHISLSVGKTTESILMKLSENTKGYALFSVIGIKKETLF